MAITISINKLLTKQILKRKKEDIALAIRKGVLFATEWLIGQVIEDQMSGRVRNDYGLNRRSGHAAGGWRKKVENEGTDIKIKVYNLFFYVKFHQKPGPKAKYPKRLYIVEYFKAEAKKVYFREISDELKVKRST